MINLMDCLFPGDDNVQGGGVRLGEQGGDGAVPARAAAAVLVVLGADGAVLLEAAAPD